MKSIEFILSILIFCMSIVPCSDGHEEEVCTSESNQLVSENIQNHSHDGHSHSGHDHCTPFCVCTCCGLTLQLTSPEVLDMEDKEFSFSFQYDYKFSYNHSYHSSIWHPPAID